MMASEMFHFFDLIAWLNYWNVGDFPLSRSQKNGDSSKNFSPPCVGPTETKRRKEWEERADLSANSLLLPPISELRAGARRDNLGFNAFYAQFAQTCVPVWLVGQIGRISELAN